MIVIILALIAAFLGYHYTQVKILTEEVNKISTTEYVNDDYKELYKTLAIDEESSQNLDTALSDLESQEEIIKSAFDYFSSIINFLSDNKDAWIIENGQILFYSQTKLDEYNEIVMNMPQIY